VHLTIGLAIGIVGAWGVGRLLNSVLVQSGSRELVTLTSIVALLVSVSGVIAMLIPYAAEIYPVQLRGTGSGVIAASSKFGGILGAALGVVGFFEHFVLSALLIAVPMAISGALLLASGIETRGFALEDIQQKLSRAPSPGG